MKTFLYGAYEWLFVRIYVMSNQAQLLWTTNFVLLFQLWLSYQQQNYQELQISESKGWRACVHHVPQSNHELSGTGCTDKNRVTKLVTKTSGTSELIAHRKEAANKKNSPSIIIKCHRTWQVTCYSPECFSVCPVYKQQHVSMESPLHCGICFFNTYTTLLFPFSP